MKGISEKMQVEYEEKTYESYFNNELDKRSNIYFPFGQVQEGVIGLDSAAFSRYRGLWDMLSGHFGFFPPFPGANLKGIADEMEQFIGEVVRNIPDMKVNILFQYKRPEYIGSPLGKEWNIWKQYYFRYDLYCDQHDLLIHLEKSFGQQALILYAAPAVKTINTLVTLKKQGKIIENSNFKKASELNNHTRNTYINAGTHSVACSEPKEIEDMNILRLLESQQAKQAIGNRDFILNTSRIAMEIMSRSNKYSTSFRDLIEEYDELSDHHLLYAFAVMKSFSELTGIQWLISIQSA
jgi:hypothetical protein